LAGSSAPCDASSVRARTASPASLTDGVWEPGLAVVGASATTGGGVAGFSGTTQVASSDRSTAITSGAGVGGAASPGTSAFEGTLAGALPDAVSVLGGASVFCLTVAFGLPSVFALAAVFGLAFVFGLAADAGLRSVFRLASVLGLTSISGSAAGTIAAAKEPAGSAEDPNAVGVAPCCEGSATWAAAGSAEVAGAGARMARRSDTSIRRSCQGKRKPGSQPPAPLKVRLNSHE
jgi:hypothetical protein